MQPFGTRGFRTIAYRSFLLIIIVILLIATTYNSLLSSPESKSQPVSQNDVISHNSNSGPKITKGALPLQQVIKPMTKSSKDDLKNVNIMDIKFARDAPSWGGESRPVSSLLQEGLIPSNMHYIWCGQAWFEYREYLSVLSVLRSIAPDKVVIHHEQEFTIDRVYYHQWIDDLKHDYPSLYLEKMDDNFARFCSAGREEQINIILNLLNQEGGIFLSTRTWILDLPPEDRKVDFEYALDDTELDGYIMMRKNTLGNSTWRELLDEGKVRSRDRRCALAHHMIHTELKGGCLIVRGKTYDHFYPMDIWERDDAFGRLTRRIFYGTEEIRKPKPSYNELVPNIGHMVWIGGGRMDFVFFLSLLSMLYVVKVDVVYIHGDVPPTGPNWDRVQNTEAIRSRVKFITRAPPLMVYQGKIEPYYVALMSDLIRVDLMIKYGGVYTDTDAIWVKGLSEEDRAYDAVASYDWVDWSWPYPDSVNFGLSYGKKNAPFWQIFRDSMRVLHNDNHGFTGVMMPYKLLEKYPEMLRIDRHLQVICYQYRCHPIWVNDYHNMSRDHITDGSLDNWREDVNAFHWTHPNPLEYANETALRHATGMFADVGRFVMEQAGLW